MMKQPTVHLLLGVALVVSGPAHVVQVGGSVGGNGHLHLAAVEVVARWGTRGPGGGSGMYAWVVSTWRRQELALLPHQSLQTQVISVSTNSLIIQRGGSELKKMLQREAPPLILLFSSSFLFLFRELFFSKETRHQRLVAGNELLQGKLNWIFVWGLVRPVFRAKTGTQLITSSHSF